MLRTIAITMVLLLSVGIMLPFANSAHGIRQSSQVTQKKSKRYRSRAWWRRYRARLRARRAAEELARRNAMMALPQNLAAALPQNVAVGELSVVAGPASPSNPVNARSLSFNDLPPRALRAQSTIQTDVAAAQTTAPSMRSITEPIAIPPAAPVRFAPAVPVTTVATPARTVATAPARTVATAPVTTVAPAPVAIAAPVPVTPANTTVEAHAGVSATRPRVVNAVRPVIAPGSSNNAPKLPGQMNLSVVALSRPNPIFLTQREQKRMLAGVPVADLKRIVIDKMVNNGGWVVNDFIREVNGNRVFVVTGRTPKDALTPEKTWTFYFTEAGGRVYGLTTESPVEYAERMTVEAERFIETLRSKPEGTKE